MTNFSAPPHRPPARACPSEETTIPTLPSALICDLRTHPIAPEMSQQSSAPQDGHSQPPHGLSEQQQAPQGQAAPAGDDQSHQLQQQVQLEQPDTTLTKIFVGGALPCIVYGFFVTLCHFRLNS